MKKNQRMTIVLVLLISVIFIGGYVTMYQGRIMDSSAATITVNTVSNSMVKMTVEGTTNSALRYSRYEYEYKHGILSIYLFETIFGGQNYPIEIEVNGNFSGLIVIEVVGRDSTRIIYGNRWKVITWES